MPLISCVMPTADRPLYAAAAIRSFLEQTFPSKELIVLDNGHSRLIETLPPALRNDAQIKFHRTSPKPIGMLRNEVCALAGGDVIAHWDDDDWSHHRRIDEQYDLLAASGADIVGYETMVFFDVSADRFALYRGMPGTAVGTSMMFRRETWERRRYPSVQLGEDNTFAAGRHVCTSSGHRPVRMIARQHSRNTSGPRSLMFSGLSNFRELLNERENNALRRLLKVPL